MDRFTRGLTAGILATVPMNVWSLATYYLNFSQIRFLDWGAIILFGNLPQNLVEVVLGQIGQILWSGFLGVIFAMLVPLVTSRSLYLKALFYGFISGFLIYALPVLLHTKYVSNVSTNTAVSNHLGGVIWGFFLAYFLILLDKRQKV